MLKRSRPLGPLALALFALLALLAMGPSTASAQGAGPAARAEAEAPASIPKDDAGGLHGGILGEFSFGQIDEDYFLTLNLGSVLRFWKIGVGLQVPLRFRVVDEKPEQSGVLRDEDWDEASDFLRVLRFVEYGRRGEPVYARLGELSGATLGHGTIVDRYYNTVDIDHYQAGVETHVDAGVAGGGLVLDNLIDPNILGLRGFVRPLQFLDVPEIFQRIEVGTSWVSDFQAPDELRRQTPGDPTSPLLLTGDGELSATTAVATIWGFDIAWTVLQHELVDLTPYFDLNFSDVKGTGVHLGLLANFHLPADTLLRMRLEYRFLSDHYAAGYVNSLYEIERYRYRGERTKLDHVMNVGEGERHGFLGEATLLLFRRVTVTAIYEDYEGANNSNLTALVRLPWLGPVRFQAFYTKRNFGEFEDIFELDNALLLLEAKVRFLSFMYVFGRYSRQWHLTESEGAADPRYETVDDWNVGVGASWEF